MGYVLTGRAMDIFTSEQGLCYILGYLARPGRIKYIEAQVPYGKEQKFMNAYPGADYDNMKITSDQRRHPDYLMDFDEGYNIPLSGRC